MHFCSLQKHISFDRVAVNKDHFYCGTLHWDDHILNLHSACKNVWMLIHRSEKVMSRPEMKGCYAVSYLCLLSYY